MTDIKNIPPPTGPIDFDHAPEEWVNIVPLGGDPDVIVPAQDAAPIQHEEDDQ